MHRRGKVEIGPQDVGPAEVGVLEVAARQVAVFKIRPSQDGSAEVAVGQVGATEGGDPQVCLDENGVLQLRAVEVGASKVSTLATDTVLKVAPLHLGILQDGSAEDGPSKICALWCGNKERIRLVNRFGLVFVGVVC